MDKQDYLDGEESAWREKCDEVINYKHYIPYLPQKIAKVIEAKVPVAFHSILPPEYIAMALVNSIQKSDIQKNEYIVEWYSNSLLVMTSTLFTVGDSQIIAIFKYLKNEKETVLMVVSNDSVNLLSDIEDVLDKLMENVAKTLKKSEKKLTDDRTIIDVTDPRGDSDF